jgi:hypothetical protein
MAAMIQGQTCREVAGEGVEGGAQRSSLEGEQQQAGEEEGEGPGGLLTAPPCLLQTQTTSETPTTPTSRSLPSSCARSRPRLPRRRQ